MTTTETDVLAGVTAIVREHFGVAPQRALPSETHLRNQLSADSIDEAEIAMQVEERFDVTIPDDAHPATIGEIAALVSKALPLSAGKR
ncbi:MAG: phosphopantetheine-binding protein [Planctomycetota bacterium]|nr:phosphopantetheine-binding protein [Planctomycetota bacterium]